MIYTARAGGMVDGVLSGIEHCATDIVNRCVLDFGPTLGVRSDIVRIYEQSRLNIKLIKFSAQTL